MTSLAEVEPVTVPGVEKTSFYRPELDCLRFFAFFAVFVHHSLPSNADFYLAHRLPVVFADIPYAGAWGVDLFFCLSAYLITELLVREKDQVGYLNVRAFYIRRMLRIWPLYFSFVLFAFALTFVDRSQQFSALNLGMFLMLAGNWAAATGTVQSFVIPLWSVSIEEQFYLLWPLAVRRASRRQMLTICLIMVITAFAWRSGLTIGVRHPDGLIWNGTFGHLDSIAYGIILSLLNLQQRIPAWRRIALLSMGVFAWLFAAQIRNQAGNALSARGRR
jgi:peptidoglycan/LPS O-acetylase OafA/YrhL